MLAMFVGSLLSSCGTQKKETQVAEEQDSTPSEAWRRMLLFSMAMPWSEARFQCLRSLSTSG